jgi:NAD(P)-dependent dehydrogenase (short-subunit alcohol dehydrogenase family)
VQPILDYYERRNLSINPLRRIAQPSEVATLISYLVSGDASYITGSTITIDGGEVLAPDNA